jgi:CubicO group peptidase (beta-lactamase class C family)
MMRVTLPKDLSLVTSTGEEEATSRPVSLIWNAVEGLYRCGAHPAISICVRHQGRVVLNRAIGHAKGNGPGAPLGQEKVLATPATPFCAFSISKSITAILIHWLDERNMLRLDDRVVDYLPGFGKYGKHRITIRHILTHRAGLPSVAGHNDPDLLLSPGRILDLLGESKPAWVPGRRQGYHAVTGGFILGAIAEKVTGKDLRDVMREAITEPLGLRWFNYGVPRESVDQVAESAPTGLSMPPGASYFVKRALGVTFARAVELSNDPRFLATVVPSGNVVATASDLGTFYEMLLHDGQFEGRRILDPRTVHRALAESSYLEADLTLIFPVRYGLGFMLGARRLSLFGPDTPHAFGHYGFVNSMGWADPDRELSVGFLTSGKPIMLGLREHFNFLRAMGQVFPRMRRRKS